MAGLERSTTEMSVRPKLTNKTLFVLGAMNMIDCINVNLLTPYVDSMVSDFLQTTPDDPQVAHTVGFLIGLYSLCEVICSPFWGALSDWVGRKPALLIGLGGSVAAPILFGLGTNLTTVFVARALDGFFCGNMGVTRTYMGEIVDPSTEAKGFGFLSLCFSLGLFIGPMLGGELVYPARWAPSVFGGTVFEEHPFLLPNLTYAVFALVSWIIGAVFLEETLPRSERKPLPCCPRRRDDQARLLDAEQMSFGRRVTRAISVGSGQGPVARQNSGADPTGVPRVFTDEALEGERAVAAPTAAPSAAAVAAAPSVSAMRALVQVVVCYCTLSGWSAASSQLFILIVSLPRSVDGFALGPQQIGALQNCCAVALLCNQLFVYPRVVRRLGLFGCFLLGWTLVMTAYSLFPVYGMVADPKYGFWRYVPLGVMQVLQAFGGGMLYPTAFTLINRAADGMARGAVNGWANSSGALCRAVFPPCAAFLLTWGSKMNADWGRYVGLYVINIVCTLLLTISLPGMRQVSAATAKPQRRRAAAAH